MQERQGQIIYLFIFFQGPALKKDSMWAPVVISSDSEDYTFTYYPRGTKRKFGDTGSNPFKPIEIASSDEANQKMITKQRL